jgi:hypothetical protein
VTSVTPNTGTAAGGTSVQIIGTGFVAGATVTFNSVAGTGVSFANSTTLNAVTPAGAAGAVTVVVTNPGGQAAGLPNGFTYTAVVTPFTIQLTAAPPVVFYLALNQFGLSAGESNTTLIGAQRTPAGPLAGTFGSSGPMVTLGSFGPLTANGTAVSAGDATITFTDSTGTTGTAVVRSAPKFSGSGAGGGPYVSGTYTIGTCNDTTPSGTFTFGGVPICSSRFGAGSGTHPFRLDIVSGAGSPAVVNLTGSVNDGDFVGGNYLPFAASTINAGGTFTATATSGTGAISMAPDGTTPTTLVPTTVVESWTVTAATPGAISGTSTLTVTPTGNSCGPTHNQLCSGSVTMSRTILSAN